MFSGTHCTLSLFSGHLNQTEVVYCCGYNYTTSNKLYNETLTNHSGRVCAAVTRIQQMQPVHSFGTMVGANISSKHCSCERSEVPDQCVGKSKRAQPDFDLTANHIPRGSGPAFINSNMLSELTLAQITKHCRCDKCVKCGHVSVSARDTHRPRTTSCRSLVPSQIQLIYFDGP